MHCLPYISQIDHRNLAFLKTWRHNKLVKPFKRFQSQGHAKQTLTEHVGKGRLPSAATVSLFFKKVFSFSEIKHLFMIKIFDLE